MDICDFGWLGKNNTIADYIKGKKTKYGTITRNYLINSGIPKKEFYALAYGDSNAWTVSVQEGAESTKKFVLIWDNKTEIHIWVLDHGFWDFTCSTKSRTVRSDTNQEYYQPNYETIEAYLEDHTPLHYENVLPGQFTTALERVKDCLMKNLSGGNS